VAEISSKIDYILGEGRWEAGDFWREMTCVLEKLQHWETDEI
jgi:hypothetical protein